MLRPTHKRFETLILSIEHSVQESIDFFVSHAGADAPWAEWVDQTLRTAGYTTVTDLYDFQAGENIILRMEGALQQAKRLLLIWSPHARDRYMVETEWTNTMAKHRDRIVPVIVEACEKPSMLFAVLHVDLTSYTSGEEAGKVLVDALSGPRRPTTPVSYPGQRSHEVPEPGVPFPAKVQEVADRRAEQARRSGGSGPPVVLWTALTRHPYAFGAFFAVLLAAVVVLIVVSLPGHDALRIYSSLPQREQRQPLNAAGGHDLPVVRNELTRDMEDAMRLALNQADGQAGDFDVTYEPLDDSNAAGESPAALVQANADRAAKDESTAVYVGDLTSGATQASIPILSRAKIPQISMSSTRIGLTTPDRRGDVDEPDRYYPAQPGYPEGYRNFVRIIPRDAGQAKALLALMAQQDNCSRVALINDNSSYGEALANNILAQNRGRVSFVFSESVGPRGQYEHLVDRVVTMNSKPECVAYCGTRNPNTVAIIEAFAAALPTAKLYGTDGLVAASFFDFRRGGVSREVAGAVKVMVPPYDVEQAERLFFRPFREAYNREADPNAVYAYEAMRVALKAIADSASGERKDILRKLLETSTVRQDSVLGKYSITPSTGDTNVASYDVSTIKDGKLTAPVSTPRLLRK